MFKKFKDKLAEEMKQSPARLQASMQQLAQAVSPALSNSSIQDLSSANDNFSLSEEGDETPKNSPARHGFQSVDLTPPSNTQQGTSRRSSISSIASTSDASLLFPIYESPGSIHHLQSDMDQSASEADENVAAQLDKISKDQLYSAYRKVQTKYQKYRGRFTDLANHYREMERAKSKLESLLVETQDKALRRIADLKEQCQLEQQAKAHLEDALRNDIEEKGHIIDTLNTKVRLLQANGSLNFQHNEMDAAGPLKENQNSEMLVDISTDSIESDPSQQMATENAQLRTKLDKLEALLSKYKESLKKNKEKITEITEEKSILERDLEVSNTSNTETVKQLTDDLNGAKDEISHLQSQISAMKTREEESVISLAENKLSIHQELEVKEDQIKKLNAELKTVNETSERLKAQVEKMKLAQSNEEKNEAIQQKLIEAEKTINLKYQKQVEDNKWLVDKIADMEKEIESQKILYEANKVENKKEESSEIEKKDLQIQELDSKLKKYTTAIMNAKEKIDAQKAQIDKLTEIESATNEDTEKFKDELESKKVELLGLESELKSCRTTVNDLREKLKENGLTIDQLKKEKICLLSNIMDYKNKMRLLKSSCQDIKSQVTDYNSKQSEVISTFKNVFETSLNNMNNYERLENLEQQLSSKFKNLEAEKLTFERELKSRDEKLSEMQANLEKYELEKQKNNKLIAEIDNLNFKIFDINKLQKELELTKMELSKARDSLKNHEAENLMEKIQELADLKEKCENYAIKLNETLSQSDNLQVENSELKKNREELISLKLECENYAKLFQEGLEKAKILEAENENLKTNWKEAESSIESFKSEILKYQSVIENQSEELKTLVAEKQAVKKSFERAEESANSLQSEILKQNSTIEEKIIGMQSWERKYIEQSEELSQLQIQLENHKKLLEESYGDSQAQTKLKNEFENQNIALEGNIKDLENLIANKDEELAKILFENNENKIILNEKESKLKSLQEEYSTLDSEKLLLKETVDAKNQMIEKLNVLKNKQTKAIQDMSAKVHDLEAKNEALKDIENSATSSKKSLKMNEERIQELAAENKKLHSNNKELEAIKEKFNESDKRILQLTNENEILKHQIENLREASESLEKRRQENLLLSAKVNEYQEEKENMQAEIKQLKDSNNQLKQSEDKYKRQIQELEALCEKHLALIADLEKSLKNQIQQLESFESEKKQLQTEYEEKLEHKTKEIQELLEKESWTRQVIEELKKRSETLELKLEEKQNVPVIGGNVEIRKEEDRLRKLVQEFQAQLQDRESKLMSSQAKESQMGILNEELKAEGEKLKQKLETAVTEQSMRMKQLVKEFQAQLHDKEEELQAALDKKFDRQQNYESDLVQQYREQLKDFQIELTAKSEEIESLKNDQSEIEKLVATIASIKDDHASELKEIDKKWQTILKQRSNQQEVKHNDQVNELTKEWRMDKFTDDKFDEKSQELENMSRVAMAAVQSNTGSFQSLQQTVMSQRRELTELRKIIKLRHDTLEDSTEIEYLRNILYEYMMGKETLVLARVIAAVVKFDQDQTNKILKKEEDKLTLLGSLRLA